MRLVLLLILPLLASASQQGIPSDRDMQSKFDAAVAVADGMLVSRLVITPGTAVKPMVVAYVPAWEVTNAAEIAELSQVIRVQTPPPSARVVDGKVEYRGANIGSYPAFSITLTNKNEVVLELRVWRHAIGCEALCDSSAIGVDSVALEPFYSRVTKRIRRQWPAKPEEKPTSSATAPSALPEHSSSTAK